MNENIISKHFERLKAVCWGSACEWNSTACDHIFNYYEKVLQVWPEDRVKLFPNNSILIESYSSRLSATEVEQANLMLQTIIKTAEDSGYVLTSMNLILIRLILTCGILVEKGKLADWEDPSEALLRLFEDGYDLSPNHGALDICYQVGCTSMPLPDRKSIVQRVRTQTFGPK